MFDGFVGDSLICLDVGQIFLTQLGILILVGIVNPFLVVPVFFLAVIFYFLRRYYMASAREVKRLEATSPFPIRFCSISIPSCLVWTVFYLVFPLTLNGFYFVSRGLI